MQLSTPGIRLPNQEGPQGNGKGPAAEDYTNCAEKPKLERLWRPAPTRKSRSEIDITRAIPISEKTGSGTG